ncbi:tRNA (uridine(54)-C5)-methyltransferase TrmA [Zhongshania aliphaticivorans]|uniref:tRNA (uridine(54)-C5)-methyltransferase TrmA n=1 Tax=Zhongshania aliphaticivorans TaxID=1470434 RepID=UPI0012E546B7|nr:tRNA (uridine(54)-C5)-methyltransferase TrmA [Zhongshania aliphaticivorans]CAA0118889.1 tRNA/tmRNA (uracil-C(5))-methyltransferase [Zhongshania aliphaticivorans]
MSINPIDIDNYPAILQDKAQKVGSIFTDLALPAPTVFPSHPAHYRLRAEFRLWHDNGDAYYAMFDPAEPKTPVRIDKFPTASKSIDDLMPVLLNKIICQTILSKRLFQVEFLSTLSGDMLVSLIYHRRLDEEWEALARTLASELNIQIIGRSKKQKLVLDRDYVVEKLPVDGELYIYNQYEGGFTQPNGVLNATMISWAKSQVKENPNSDLLELYCGNGNFTIPLSKQFRKVLATEISKTSVKAAHENFALNNVNNIDVLRMSSEELTSALNKERSFRRLEHIDLDSYNINTVLVDPPRAGLDNNTRELISTFEHIVYISCNPETLHRDLQILTKTHTADAFALFDQFPYTHHMECGVFLKRRGQP